ncbi:MAG: VCBS repeat-containing protein [Planctomycetes bacterium]|nr:VCBS repeat-containing protein [Planctomycetota bacterium]
MQILPSRALVALMIVATAATASAQFDNQWVSFTLDNSRLKTSAGAPATHVTGDVQEKDMAWGDLDQDGWIDLVIVRKQPVTSTGAFPNYLMMNEGGQLVDRSAQYAAASDVPGDNGFLTPTNDRDVVLVDVNNDGWLDVVTCTTRSNGQPKHISHPRVYMNLGRSGGVWLGLRFENNRIPTFAISPNFCGMAAGDVTGDGYADLYFTDYGQSGVGELFDRLLINDGTGNFTDSVFTRLTQVMLDVRFGSAVDIVDMNLDGKLDIVRCSGTTGSGAGPLVSVAYNDPNNIGFFPSAFYQAQIGSNAPYHVDVGDLNNDGRPDIITSDDGQDAYRFNLSNDALGRVVWSAVRNYTYVTGGSEGFAGTNLIVDLDNDGWNDSIHADVDVDIAGCNRRCHIFHNRGGTPGSEIIMAEEAGSASGAWRGVVGMLVSDLTGTFDVAVFDIDNDGDKDMVFGRCTGTFVWMNQLYQPTTFTSFCAGDGSSAACPCGNVGAAGNGCPSSVSAAGGKLAGGGLARISADSLVLTNTLVPNGPGLYYQGSGTSEIAFGDGKLCAGVGIVRLGVVFASGSTSSYPGGLTPAPIHIAGMTNAGDTRHYQTWYRDSTPGFCTPSLFNLTNGLTLAWTP